MKFLPLLIISALASSSFAQLPWDDMDLGSFQSGCFQIGVIKNDGSPGDQLTAKGIAIKVGEGDAKATVLFDTELLRVSAAWTGGFIKFPRGRGGLEGQIGADGQVQFSTAYAPGWVKGEAISDDPRPEHQGHLDADAAKWRGLYTHGDQVILYYTVGATPVLELPAAVNRGGTVFTRSFTLGKTDGPLSLLIADAPKMAAAVDGMNATLTSADRGRMLKVAVSSAPEGSRLKVSEEGRVTLVLPALSTPSSFEVALWTGATIQTPASIGAEKQLENLTALTHGGPIHWGDALESKGVLGDDKDAYVIDLITLPEDNPYKSWLRPGGHDFFPNGDAALVSISGDVWLVSGLDEKLEHIKWKRFATGLFQPLGCKIVDDKIYVLGRDQITRLHDLNNDGEADFYECFNNDCVVTDNYHEFALDLETDRAGNFYYAKGSPWTPTNRSPHQGTIIKVSKDGAKFEVIATGLRAPNGLGVSPDDVISCSDNQGHWMPANRLNIIKPGGFYGMVPAAHRELKFTRADGTTFTANPSTQAARDEFKTEFWGRSDTPTPDFMDPPMVWMPQNVDNSPGDEVWVPKPGKWGPLAGQMLHLSYGHCILYNVLQEKVDGVEQGAVVPLAGKFASGIMRSRFSPKDGQLYVCGLNVWQSDASKFGCFNRVRYSGKPVTQPIAIKNTSEGVTLTFTSPLDPKSATDRENYSVERWNYRWTGEYGSPDVSVANPKKKGRDLVLIDEITLSPDQKTLTLKLPDMAPVMQMKIKYRLKNTDGEDVDQEIHSTINKLPGVSTAVR